MKRVGIDYGTKKIGVAISSDDGVMAFPLAVVPNNDRFLAYLEALVQERGVAEIVIGESLNQAGQPNTIQAAIEELMTDITLHLGLPVHLEPEQYTTQAATRLQGRNRQTDAAAAALILDSFIQKHS